MFSPVSLMETNYLNCWKRIDLIRTVTFPLFTKHRVAGQLFNIPLMYNLILWNNFLTKKINKKICKPLLCCKTLLLLVAHSCLISYLKKLFWHLCSGKKWIEDIENIKTKRWIPSKRWNLSSKSFCVSKQMNFPERDVKAYHDEFGCINKFWQILKAPPLISSDLQFSVL